MEKGILKRINEEVKRACPVAQIFQKKDLWFLRFKAQRIDINIPLGDVTPSLERIEILKTAVRFHSRLYIKEKF